MLGVDHNVLVPLHRDDLGIAVGITAMIYEARQPALHYRRFWKLAALPSGQGRIR